MLNDQSLAERLIGVFREIMDEDAEFSVGYNAGAAIVTTSWPLGDDPSRPNKRSRTIRISVERRITDMLRADDQRTLGDLEREMCDVAGRRMREFVEDPELPRGQPVEPFDIHIHAVDLDAFKPSQG